jgi:hypothetical protein
VIVVDTNVLSELMRPSPDAGVIAWARAVPRRSFATTAVAEAELRAGLARLPPGSRKDALTAGLEAVLARIGDAGVLPFDRGAAPHHAAYLSARHAAGRPVAVADAMIAAIARARSAAALATRNVADFEGCGVPLIDRWRAA